MSFSLGINFAFIANDKINELADAENYLKKSHFEDFSENDRVIIEDGPLKGHITKILSLSVNERVNVLIY